MYPNIAVRNECSATLSGSLMPAVDQPDRFTRLSCPISYTCFAMLFIRVRSHFLKLSPAALFRYWLEDVHKAKVRLSTYERYRSILHVHLIPGLGHIKLQKLSTRQVQSFYAGKLKGGLSARRVRSIHAVLHKALDHARRLKFVGENVCDDVELPRVKEREMQVLTPEQAQLLLQLLRKHRLEALLTLALATGMREGEILGLRWRDVDLERGMLQIRCTLLYLAGHGFVENEPKTEKSKRQIKLSPFVITALEQHRIAQFELRLKKGPSWRDNGLVFPTSKGTFINPTNLNRQFARLLKKMGLPHLRFHDLRHSAATLLISMKVDPKTVQELLGHSDINITLRTYAHVLPSMRQEATDKMEGLFGQQS